MTKSVVPPAPALVPVANAQQADTSFVRYEVGAASDVTNEQFYEATYDDTTLTGRNWLTRLIQDLHKQIVRQNLVLVGIGVAACKGKIHIARESRFRQHPEFDRRDI